MATELVPSPSKRSCDLTMNSDMTVEMNTYIETAREALLFRKFDKCHKDCLVGINKAKLYTGRPSTNEFIEQLCVLCIQALAELNKWQEVLPLVQTVYNSIENCPHTVIALCILLHARVKEFIQCHAIANVWLRNQERKDTASYREVVNLYIEHVIVPQGHIHLIPQFLDSCTALDTVSKEEIIESWRALPINEKECETVGDESTQIQKPLSVDDEDDLYSQLVSHIKATATQIIHSLPFPSLSSISKVAAAAVAIILIFKFTAKGNMTKNVNRVKQILQGILRTLTSVFTPYRMGR